MPGVVRFRVHRTGIPVQTTLGVTDRSCITFCISVSKIQELAGPLEQVYQHLRTEIGQLGKQELQRILPFIWFSGKNRLPNFFAHQNLAFLDFRKYAKQPDTKIQNRIQEILISMDIPYHFQKRSILILYASGMLLETFRQALFYEDIILPFGKEEGCFQCNFDSNAQPDSWQIELQIIGSTKYEAYQIEDDGTLLDSKGDVVPELIKYLAQEYDASNIRTAIVHVQGKGQQKIVAFLAKSSIQQQIPCVIKDHQGTDRMLQYKQPDVLTDPPMSNVHIKEMREDHHIISQAKGNNQHARISAFFPFPHNELSRRRFNRVKSINVCVNRSDMLCTVLDEAVPVCLVNQELATQEAACLLEFLIHKQPILNHHSAFLSCSFSHPEQSNHDEVDQESLLTLPYFSSIVHCHLSCNQTYPGLRMAKSQDVSATAYYSQFMSALTLSSFLLVSSRFLISLKLHPEGTLLQFGKLLMQVRLPMVQSTKSAVRILQIFQLHAVIVQPKKIQSPMPKLDALVPCKALNKSLPLTAREFRKSPLAHNKQHLL